MTGHAAAKAELRALVAEAVGSYLVEIVKASEARGWVMGYLSGYVRYTGNDVFSRMKGSQEGSSYLSGIATWIENWCQANPGRGIKEAVEALNEAMRR